MFWLTRVSKPLSLLMCLIGTGGDSVCVGGRFAFYMYHIVGIIVCRLQQPTKRMVVNPKRSKRLDLYDLLFS